MSSGRIELRHGWPVFGLVASGVFGLIPFAVWCTMSAFLITTFTGDQGNGGSDSWILEVLGAVACVGLLGSPVIAPWLVLRARQPRGAHIEWDDDSVVEWDGPWKRAVVAWRHVRAAHVTWVVRGGSHATTLHAIQLVDAVSGAAISVWETPPDGAPVIRRRLASSRVPALLEALEQRGVPLSNAADWSLAADPERQRSKRLLILGRLGYPCAALAPFFKPMPSAGLALGALATILLTYRAWPVLKELRIVRARVQSVPAPVQAPETPADPYRVDGRIASSDETGHHAADRLKLRAIRLEAFARLMFVLLTIETSIAGNVLLP